MTDTTKDERDWTMHPGLLWGDELVARGLSQVEVATAIGVSAKHLNQVIKGHVLPSAGLTVAFCRHLHLDPWVMWRLVARYRLDLALGKRDITHD